MDYIALNHTNKVYGVHYNSTKPIGGIRYYDPQEQKIIPDPKTGKTKVIVDTKDINKPKTNLISTVTTPKPEPKKITSSIPEIKKVTYEDLREKLQDELEQKEDLQKIQGNNYKKTEELITQEKIKEQLEAEQEKAEINTRVYVVSIQGVEVNFSELGIKKKRISRKNKKWLSKAQNYFLTVEEKGVKIGSAESYTTMEILEALWRTADQAGVDPKRFVVQIYNESRFNPNLTGKAGEKGLGQFKKTTAEYHGYNWKQMTNGTKGYAYQAKAAAEFVKQVGELAYNGGGKQAEIYQDKISKRISRINKWNSNCAMKDVAYCSSQS
jgi:hypothetical protein